MPAHLICIAVTSPFFDSGGFLGSEQRQGRHTQLETPLPIFFPSALRVFLE